MIRALLALTLMAAAVGVAAASFRSLALVMMVVGLLLAIWSTIDIHR